MRIHQMAVHAVVALLFVLLSAPVAMADSIAATVNDQAITTNQVAQRARLLRLERRGASDNARITMARDELIDEQLKIQEADRLGLVVTTADVDQAYLNIARNLNISTDNLNNVLQQNGVAVSTLRDRLKAQIAWQRISQAVIANRVQFSEVELEQQAASKLTDADGYDYILKEVRFIIPSNSNVSQSRRMADANKYRQSFQGCDSAVQLSLSYTDAAVIDVGRRHATQLPDEIANELAGLSVGGITKPRVVENGVSMLAVCDKTSAQDLTFVTNEVRQEVGSEKLQEAADAYLKELRDKANIITH
ncbi:MAG: peptidylprolyl isomerase [Hyphomicrobiaceae bacterium]|nr:peptidylprolyl isomerase [Hyphomicrobiaceae bacterium]MCC0024689.1 peptidylprolyl isomerase [Hyphomicrobiaceae bacterium]